MPAATGVSVSKQRVGRGSSSLAIWRPMPPGSERVRCARMSGATAKTGLDWS